ncbi:MAG TPA: Ni/Fe hydrogenase subunit alpha [Thiotrichales bacterium]|nr:Ni/Fe hydrogenase subunit alpha [Thiotrichales bacterium]
MTESRDISIQVPVLTRVEGEGALELDIHQGRIEALRLRIYEPPRLFEKFLEGRAPDEVIDMVARICGICPAAYQMTAVQALEALFGVRVDPWVAAMRRVFYCAEWLQSHALHIHLLALPDFLGYDVVTGMAQDYPAEVRRGLRLQALGNDLLALFGGRSVHPVGVRVGGFHRAPPPERVARMRKRLVEAQQDATDLLRWVASLALPEDEQDFVCVALRHEQAYPLGSGRIVSSEGLDISPAEFGDHFEEFQVPHSTALHALLDGRPYLVGPLARVNLNLDRLPEELLALLDECGIRFPSRNMYHSLLARAAEIWLAVHEATRLLADYRVPAQSWVQWAPRAGTAVWATEAPRGLLWHRYELDNEGRVMSARIVPPTSQNQARIEEDLKTALEAFGLDREEAELRHRGETIIRNYDPCISCATHFLRLRVNRSL